MDEKLLTAAIDARIAAATRSLATLQDARADLVARAAGAATEPWEVELGLVADYDARAGERVIGTARRLLADAAVSARALDDDLDAPKALFLSVVVEASDEVTAVALAKGVVLAAGGDPDYYHWELGPDWDIAASGPVAQAAAFAWRHEGSVQVANERALAVLDAWEHPPVAADVDADLD